MYVWLSIEARSCNHISRGKAIIITNCKRVSVALGIEHTMRMRHIVMYSLARFTMFFHTISKTGRFRGGGGMFLNTKYVFWFSLQLFFWCISHSKKKWARYDKKNVQWSSWKAPVFLVRFQWHLNFLKTCFRKKYSVISFNKNHPSSGAELFYMDGQTDRQTDRQKDKDMTISSRFSQICKRA